LRGIRTRKKTESLAQKLHSIIIRIPINPTTLTAVLLLTQQVIELARVCKVPLQVEKVATTELPTVTPAQIEQVTADVQTPTEVMTEGEK
jgi:hypothetical protein